MRQEWIIKNQKIVLNDCIAEMDSMNEKSIDVVVTSPPYNLNIDYNLYNDKLKYEDYWTWMTTVVKSIQRVLKDNGSFFLNVGGTCLNPYIPFEMLNLCKSSGLTLQNNIIWVKSIAIRDDSYGHFKPVPGKRFVNNQHESIFHLTKQGNVTIDRLAIGCPYADKCLSAETLMLAKVNDKIRCTNIRSLYKSYGRGAQIFIPSYDFDNKVPMWSKLINFSESFQETKLLKLKGGINVYASANHRFPVNKKNTRKNINVLSCLSIGEINDRCKRWKSKSLDLYYTQDLSGLVPEKKSTFYNYETGKVIGLYLAEGFTFGQNAFRFAANKKEWNDESFGLLLRNYFANLGKKVKLYKSKVTNGIQMQIDCSVFKEIINKFISGNSALTKRIKIEECAKFGKDFIKGILDGFLVGDGHYRNNFDYYAVGICNNQKLTNDIRTCCLLVGYEFKQNKTTISTAPDGKTHKRINFWIRKYCNGGKRTSRDNGLYLERLEAIKDGKRPLAKTKTYDIEIDNKNSLFFLANGLMTHNSNVGRYSENDLRCRGNTWFIPYKTTQTKKQHPAGFPVDLPCNCVKLHGIKPNMVVFDPFLGAGTTLSACQQLGVTGIGVDLDIAYCEMAIEILKV